MKKSFYITLFLLITWASHLFSAERIISQKELKDKIFGYWIGQLAGNYMGYPFENLYQEEPVSTFVDRYYFYRTDHDKIRIHTDLRNSYADIMAEAFEGAFSDDDTDIELVTLYAVEKYGLDITYPEITQMWKKHINRRIWCANRFARDLMDKGMVPPATGKRENNKEWFQIDAQLVNEIWSAFYPGMTAKAAERALWGAKITNDDWGTHPTIAYAIMYSAAFFEKDPQKLVKLALEGLPKEGPFYEGVQDIIKWHNENPDWKTTRKLIFDKYFAYKKGNYTAPVSIVSSLPNGLFGIMAILYGEGDFTKTVGIAVTAGLDCDNQAATCGGLVAVMNGSATIPHKFTHELSADPSAKWEKPFNDHYLNYTRDDLPISLKISDITDRIFKITEMSILANGGRKFEKDNEIFYAIQTDFK